MQISASRIFARIALAAGAVLIAACGQGQDQAQKTAVPPTIRIDGSSTVFPLSEAVAEAFAQAQPGGARVTVGESGTGGGFRRFCRGETAIQDASRPILSEEMQTCRAAGIAYVEIPVAFDGITIVVNPSNPVNAMSVAELKRMWAPDAQGRIRNWREVNPSWPNLPLQLFGAGTASGTFDFFTEAIIGKTGASRTDYTPTEDDNVTVQGVAGNDGALGYFGIAYYEQNRQRLKAVAIDNGRGPVAPSAANVANGTYQPLSRPLFIYVNAAALRQPAVRRFVDFYVANAGRLAPRVGYVALPEDAYRALAERVAAGRTGTAFAGRQAIGVGTSDVLARELSSN